MVTILPHTTRAVGTVLTATIYNADHQNHITNATTIDATAAYKDQLNTFTGATNTFKELIINSSIYRDVNNGVLNIFGGTSGNGANIELYGGTHATQANNAFYDSAAHAFRGAGGAGTPTFTIGGSTAWHAGNDGAGSTLDADLLDGQQGSFYQNATNLNAGTVADARLPTASQAASVTNASNLSSGTVADARLPTSQAGKTFTSTVTVGSGDTKVEIATGAIEIANSGTCFIDFKNLGAEDFDVRLQLSGTNLEINGNTVWHAGNDGPGSGLNADVLDGLNQTSAATASTVMSRDGSANTAVNMLTAAQLSYSSALIIGPSGSENFRFNVTDSGFLSNGLTVTKLGITEAGSGLSFAAGGVIWASRAGAVQMMLNRDTNDGVCAQFGREKVLVGSISVTGSATAYNTSSDIRLKQDFKPINPDLLNAIKVYDFEWKNGSGRAYGCVAQELVDVVPQAVRKGETEEEMWDVDYSKLVPILIAKIQSLEARLKDMENGYRRL